MPLCEARLSSRVQRTGAEREERRAAYKYTTYARLLHIEREHQFGLVNIHFISLSPVDLYCGFLWRDVIGRLTQKQKILLARWWYYQLGYGPGAFGIKACSRPFSIKLSSMMGWPLWLGWSLKIKKASLSSPIVLDKWGYCFPCHSKPIWR